LGGKKRNFIDTHGQWTQNIAIGGERFVKTVKQSLCIRANAWNDPAVGDMRDQYAFEVFYRLQVWTDFAIIAETQFLLNPALNLDEELY
jgi:hypothetical protein